MWAQALLPYPLERKNLLLRFLGLQLVAALGPAFPPSRAFTSPAGFPPSASPVLTASLAHSNRSEPAQHRFKVIGHPAGSSFPRHQTLPSESHLHACKRVAINSNVSGNHSHGSNLRKSKKGWCQTAAAMRLGTSHFCACMIWIGQLLAVIFRLANCILSSVQLQYIIRVYIIEYVVISWDDDLDQDLYEQSASNNIYRRTEDRYLSMVRQRQ